MSLSLRIWTYCSDIGMTRKQISEHIGSECKSRIKDMRNRGYLKSKRVGCAAVYFAALKPQETCGHPRLTSIPRRHGLQGADIVTAQTKLTVYQPYAPPPIEGGWMAEWKALRA